MIIQRWSWSFWNPLLKAHEAIDFYVLMPNPIVSPLTSRNNSSCVLLIQWRDQRVLLTGDIEKEAEQAIISSKQKVRADILVAAHHGSPTSTTKEFLHQVNPSVVVISEHKKRMRRHWFDSQVIVEKPYYYTYI